MNYNSKDKNYKYKLFHDCKNKHNKTKTVKIFDEQKLEEREEIIENEHYRSFADFPRLAYAQKEWDNKYAKCQDDRTIFDFWLEEVEWVDRATPAECLRYLGVEEFKKSVMINISPHWDEYIKDKLLSREKDALDTLFILNRYLERLARELLKLKWFNKFEYGS